MTERKRTRCVLCGNLCGLEVEVKDNRMGKVRADKEHPRSQGYICRKGTAVAHYQHHGDRLLYPMKKVGDAFERISWDQALDEIAEKLQAIVGAHGPRSLALMGGATLASTVQIAFGLALLHGLGSQYWYSAVAQELTGRYWVDGRTFGHQSLHLYPDEENTDMLLIVGKNPMMSHHFQRARTVLKEMASDPERLLVVVDPRRTETAKIADIHLAIRPGTDALFYRAMISIILNEGWHNQDYIDRHVSGFEQIRSWFTDFDAKAALAVCELDFEQVREVSRLFATRKSSHDSDLGVLMNRHSTLVSYLETVLRAVCGRIGVPGGYVLPGTVFGLDAHSDEKDPNTWRTVATNFPAINGMFPPNVVPEEILSDHPERLRAVIVSAANPLRSFADTAAYEKAFASLDLLVSIDIAMTETAAASHYVLPDLSGYESWNVGLPLGSYPKVHFQLNQPCIRPEGEQLEAADIFTRLADRLGLVPDFPDSLYEAAASGDRLTFGFALMEFMASNPDVGAANSLRLGEDSGEEHGIGQPGGHLGRPADPVSRKSRRMPNGQASPPVHSWVKKSSRRAWSIPRESGSGKWTRRTTWGDWLRKTAEFISTYRNWRRGWRRSTRRRKQQRSSSIRRFPFVMSSGNHMDTNANTAMRDPAWNKGKRACTLYMNPGTRRRTVSKTDRWCA